MRNPFRSEVEAYHFLLLTVSAFAAIAVASLLGGAWAGVPVWGVVTAAAAFFYLGRGRSQRQLRTAPAHVGGKYDRRVLVLASETVADDQLAEEIERATRGYDAEVLVVCPTPVSHVRHWTSDLDGARKQAQGELDSSLSRLRASGIPAHGEIGDEDPLQAIEDALRTFGADEIIVVTPSDQPANRPGHSLATAARERFALPVTHIGTGG